MSTEEPTAIPYGYCHCGCGERTPLATMTRTERGQRKGEPLRFIHGHNSRGMLNPAYVALRYTVEDRGYETRCHIWQLGIEPNGYGKVGGGAKTKWAHRAAYEAVHGSVPPGLDLDHLCRVRACVNPAHLEPVTRTENVRRGAATKLSDDDVAAIRSRVAAGETQTAVALAFGIRCGYVSRLVNGHNRRAA